MHILELANCLYGLIIVLGTSNALCDWLGLKDTSAAGETRARTDNLAQASRTRLSESGGGSPKSFFAKGRLGDQFIILSE